MKVKKAIKLMKRELKEKGYLNKKIKDRPYATGVMRFILSNDDKISVSVTTGEDLRGNITKTREL